MSLVTIDNVLLTVTDPITDGGVIKFKISICANTASEETLGYIYRRFSEFDSVFKRLASMNAIPPLPPLPEKKMFGSSDTAFVEQRRLQIQTFLRGVQSSRDLSQDHEFHALIQFPPPLAPTRSLARALFASGAVAAQRSGKTREAAAAHVTAAVRALRAVRLRTGPWARTSPAACAAAYGAAPRSKPPERPIRPAK